MLNGKFVFFKRSHQLHSAEADNNAAKIPSGWTEIAGQDNEGQCMNSFKYI